MEVIPAIDLRDGRCVRLRQGDFDREEAFSTDPVAVAQTWQEQGARRLHVVDLDGAAEGRPVNLDVIERIVSQAGVPVQVGGGIRKMETARRLADLGVERVVLGTAAVEGPELVTEVLGELGAEAVVVSVDARGGRVAVRGWKEQGAATPGELLQEMERLGVRRFVYTDVARDGTLTQPNFQALEELLALVSVPVIAAGGIATTAHLVRLAELGVEGAIVGMALYTGAIELPEALEAVAGAVGGES